MAAGTLLTLLDDIASVLDDVAVMTKLAAKKTAGVLGDDLALNAKQVSGVTPAEELPVVFAVAKGSAVNKLILVPAALVISALLPWAVMPLMMIGGAYLCFEGVEKIVHKFLHPEEKGPVHAHAAAAQPEVPLNQTALIKEKIKGAVRTDFILSAEIIVISLGTVKGAPLMNQVMVLAMISVIMTVGVYGLVAGIVKLDDAGLHLSAKAGAVPRMIGRGLLAGAPWLMKFLSVAGTVAMFTVGGDILVHGIPPLEHAIEHLAEGMRGTPGVGGFLAVTAKIVLPALAGLVAGAVVLLVVLAGQKLWRKSRPTTATS